MAERDDWGGLVRDARAAGLVQAVEGARFDEILGGVLALVASPALVVPEGTWRVEEVHGSTPEANQAAVTIRWSASLPNGDRRAGVHAVMGDRTPIAMLRTALEAFVVVERAARAALRGDGPLRFVVMPRRMHDHEMDEQALIKIASDIQEIGMLEIGKHRAKVLAIGVEAEGVVATVDGPPELRALLTTTRNGGFSIGSKS